MSDSTFCAPTHRTREQLTTHPLAHTPLPCPRAHALRVPSALIGTARAAVGAAGMLSLIHI
eukprot:752396-Rhodomonas_salina.2